MAIATPTVTFFSGERVTDPIPVPLWSMVSWIDALGREQQVYVSDSKFIAYHGPFYIDGVKREPPALKPIQEDTRMMPVVRRRRKRSGIYLPRWAFILQQVVFWGCLIAIWVWEWNR